DCRRVRRGSPATLGERTAELHRLLRYPAAAGVRPRPRPERTDPLRRRGDVVASVVGGARAPIDWVSGGRPFTLRATAVQQQLPEELPLPRRPMAKSNGSSENVGSLIEIKGVVIDAVFPNQLPEIYSALRIERPDGGTLIAEVQQHLGDDRVRAVAMDSTD